MLVVLGDRDFAGPGDQLAAALPDATLPDAAQRRPLRHARVVRLHRRRARVPRRRPTVLARRPTSTARVAALARGGLVAIPTETVYGLAADATTPAAVRRIFAVKGRPADHPLIVHLADADAARRLGARRAAGAPHALADACWPGPADAARPARRRACSTSSPAAAPTVGLRVPAHPLTLELLGRFGGGARRAVGQPLRAGQPDDGRPRARRPRRPARSDLDVILDGGPCPIGVESTIVDCTVDPPQSCGRAASRPRRSRRSSADRLADAAGPSRASGMLASHYAPRCRGGPRRRRRTRPTPRRGTGPVPSCSA